MAFENPDSDKNLNQNFSSPLTPMLLKSYKGFEDLSDEEAQEIVNSLESLAQILINNRPEDDFRK